MEYWNDFSREQLSAARDNVYEHAMTRIQSRCRDNGTLVDVGCGGGRFLSCAQAQGWKAIGFDLCERAAEHGRTCGLMIYQRNWLPCPLEAEAADAVTFLNVLDHLPRPFAALEEARRVLRPGGLLYVRVPNGPVHARLGRMAAALQIPDFSVIHLYGFGKRAFEFHLPRLGFTDVEVRTSPPTQADAYACDGGGAGRLRRCVKKVDYLAYRLSQVLGIDRLGWGLSLEVMAVKPQH